MAVFFVHLNVIIEIISTRLFFGVGFGLVYFTTALETLAPSHCQWPPDWGIDRKQRKKMRRHWNLAQVRGSSLSPGSALSDFESVVEFNNAGCLLISEVKYLLENRDKDAPDTAYVVVVLIKLLLSSLLPSVYNKTLEYVKTFTKFNTTDSASAVRECVLFTTTLPYSLILFFKDIAEGACFDAIWNCSDSQSLSRRRGRSQKCYS